MNRVFVSKFLVLTLSLLALSACEKHEVGRHQQPTAEDQVVDLTDGGGDANMLKQRESEQSREIESLMAQHQEASDLLALEKLNHWLMGSPSEDTAFSRSQQYAGLLGLYVQLFRESQSNQRAQALNSVMLASIQKFSEMFVKPCLEIQPGQCDRLRYSLSNEKNLVLIMLYLADQESQLQKRLALLGFTYDLTRGRAEERLSLVYFNTLLAFFKQPAGVVNAMERAELRRHQDNFTNLLVARNWSEMTELNVEVFKDIEPWNNNVRFAIDMKPMKEILKPWIPLYFAGNTDVAALLQAHVQSEISNWVQQGFDLKTIPAYSDIDPIGLSQKQNTLSNYLFLAIYRENLDNRIGSEFLRSTQDPRNTAKEVAQLARTFVRWDIAQLGIDSTKKLAKEFGKYPIKTTEAFTDTLDYSKVLTRTWAEFHNGRKSSIQKFVLANHEFMSEEDHKFEKKFYEAIDRNIMKAVIYPNMLAFMYHLSKSEWKRIVTFMIWTFEIDTTVLYTHFFSGAYQYPWFNFINLNESNKTSWNLERKNSLYRDEILDSLYFFFTTKTFQEYDIPVDDLMTSMTENLMRDRKNQFEKVLDKQQLWYFNPQKPTHQWLQWCNNVQDNKKPAETLDFYKLHTQLLPFSKEIKGLSQDSAAHTLFLDKYYLGLDSGPIDGRDVHDRFRTEYLPLLNMVGEIKGLMDRLQEKQPQLSIPNLEKFQAYTEELEHLRLVFLGQQRQLEEMVGNCGIFSATESRRRAMEIAKIENLYLRELVYPIFQKMKNGEIGVDEANQSLKNLPINGRGFEDRFIKHSDNQFTYYFTAQSFFLRTIQYLRFGLTHEGQILAPAVVGPQLRVEVVPHFLTDTENPYGDKSNQTNYEKAVSLYDSTTVDLFAKTVIPFLTDATAGANGYVRFSSWDKGEAKDYVLDFSANVDFHVQRYFMKGQTYLDLTNPECPIDAESWNEDCILTENFSLMDLGKKLNEIFSSIELNEDRQQYFDMIIDRGYLWRTHLGILLEKDPRASSGGTGNWLQYSNAAGFFDLAFEMMKSDTIGMTFNNGVIFFEYTQGTTSGGVAVPTYNCGNSRNSCPWGNYRTRALELFVARKKRPGLIFKMDETILQDQYQRAKNDLDNFYRGPLDIYENGQAVLDELRPNKDYVVSTADDQPLQLRTLRVRNTEYQVDIDQFKKERTESYFLVDPQWDHYFLWKE